MHSNVKKMKAVAVLRSDTANGVIYFQQVNSF